RRIHVLVAPLYAFPDGRDFDENHLDVTASPGVRVGVGVDVLRWLEVHLAYRALSVHHDVAPQTTIDYSLGYHDFGAGIRLHYALFRGGGPFADIDLIRGTLSFSANEGSETWTGTGAAGRVGWRQAVTPWLSVDAALGYSRVDVDVQSMYQIETRWWSLE